MTPTPHGQVPEALRLAEEISNLVCSSEAAAKTIAAAADELCRLHVENASLRAALAATPTPPAEQQAAKAAPTRTALPEGWTDCTIEFGNDGPEVVAYGPKRMMNRLAKWLGKYFAQVIADAAPKTAPGVGNSGFDHQTAADFLSGKTVSDEAVRKFVAASRWAHDERAALSATLLAMHGVLTSREAEIALLKKALLEAEAAPQPAPHLPERDASLPAERQGLFRKFVVGRVDGSDKPFLSCLCGSERNAPAESCATPFSELPMRQ